MVVWGGLKKHHDPVAATITEYIQTGRFYFKEWVSLDRFPKIFDVRVFKIETSGEELQAVEGRGAG